jgi:fluoride exporter
MNQILAITIGSILGGLGRYFLAGSLPFPWGTLTVNVLGCFVAGIFSVIAEARFGPAGRLLLLTGFCGAFTTFSAFMLETDVLMGSAQAAKAVSYVFLSLMLGFLLFRAGSWLAIHVF